MISEWIAAQQFVAHFSRQYTKSTAIRLKKSNITYGEIDLQQIQHQRGLWRPTPSKRGEKKGMAS